MADDSHPEDESDISPITLPTNGFQSRIPPSLLQDKSKEEQDLYNDISKISAFVDWAAPLLVDSNLQQRKTNGKVKRLQAWKDMFTSWWGLVIAAITLVGGIAGAISVLEFILKLIAK